MKTYENIKTIKGIGDKTASLLNKLNIETVDELMRYYPRTYIQYEEPIKLKEFTENISSSVRLFIPEDFKWRKVKNMTIGTGFATDGELRVNITFFNTVYYKAKLIAGSAYIFHGKIENENGRLKMVHPEFYTEYEYATLKKSFQPVYSLVKGLSNKTILKAIRQCTEDNEYPYIYGEYLPCDILKEFDLISEKEALKGIHFPDSKETLLNAKKRLSFDELMSFLLMIRSFKGDGNPIRAGFELMDNALPLRLIERLPYKLTNAQIKAFSDIRADLTGGFLMNRLIQGDVGSGKTVVAFLSMLLVAGNGYQSALMAPTEILALQHYENLISLKEKYDLPINPVLLTGSTTAKNKRIAYEGLKSGEFNIAIGTHALIQEKTEFKNLALVITDEQHRFGVRQRQSLSDKGIEPHVLIMSATPIPRTLSIVLYGDMHLTVIDEKPANRLPVKNALVDTSYRQKAYEFMVKEIRNHHQIYIICPMVEPNEGLENVENVIEYSERLQNILPNDINIKYLHGKMNAKDKNNIMENFAAGNIDILVSTTVVEVGVDVPNATVMLIENAERFGLSALHQLRGRIGRSDLQSYCIFVNGNPKNKDNEKLKVISTSNDGFHIANEDLKLRGAGDMFGIRQSGDTGFKIADIIEDAPMILKMNEYLDRVYNSPSENLEIIKSLDDYLAETQNKFIDFKTI